MFIVELDVHLIFTPPMHEERDGIIVTRSFQLPFPPSIGLQIYHRGLIWDAEPNGMKILELVWDNERQIFLATARHVCCDFPFTAIAGEIQEWVARGWRLGSFKDYYTSLEMPDFPTNDFPVIGDPDRTNYEHLHTLAPSGRPAIFNLFIKGLVRHMAVTYGNWDEAYAMDQTGRYLGSSWQRDCEIGDTDAIQTKWDGHVQEFNRMSKSHRIDWMQKVEKYTPLEEVLFGDQLEVARQPADLRSQEA